jgi:hypothetical protein
VPNDATSCAFPKLFYFQWHTRRGLTRTLIKLETYGDFGAPLVVFNQRPANGGAKILTLGVRRVNALNPAPCVRG